MPHIPVQYSPSVLAQQVGASPLPELRQTLKYCATTIRWCVTSIIGCELVTLNHQGTGDQVLCVLALLNTPGHLQ